MSPDPITPPVTSAAMKANDALADIVVLATEAQPPSVPSTSGSWAGWSLTKWLVKQKSELKTLASIAAGLGSAWISANLTGNWAVLIGGGFGLLTRFVLDWLDYGLTDSPK